MQAKTFYLTKIFEGSLIKLSGKADNDLALVVKGFYEKQVQIRKV